MHGFLIIRYKKHAIIYQKTAFIIVIQLFITHSTFSNTNSFWCRIKISGIENSDDKVFLINENKNSLLNLARFITKNIAAIQLSEVPDVPDVLALTLLRL